MVQKSFSLITLLPDKVLRWIGGVQESIGAETAGWTDETKGKIGEADKATQGGISTMSKQLGGGAAQFLGGKSSKGGAKSEGKKGGGSDDDDGGGGGGGLGGGSSTPPPEEAAMLA